MSGISENITVGHVLRGNGTNFVDAAIIASDLSGVAAGIVGSDNHSTEITGNYGPVTLLTPAATGLFRVSGYAEADAAVVLATLQVVINYTDDTGANSQNSGAAIPFALTGANLSFSFILRSTATAITYSTVTTNSPKYKIFARVEAL
jgi:hypothetical protein